MTEQRPTPMTDQMEASLAKSSNVRRYYAALAQMRLMEVERDEAREELKAMREAIKDIYFLTEGCADGAPDASAHDKLCNEVAAKLQPFLKTKGFLT